MVAIFDGIDMTEKQLMQALSLDRAVYPREYWLDRQTVLSYWQTRPEVYIYAAEGKDLIAYLNTSCIDRESYLALCSGRQNDLCIGAENLREPSPGAENYLYFSSIVVDASYRGNGIARRLLFRFGEKLEALRRRGICFSDILADAVSAHGEKLCLSLGMRFDKSTSCGSKLFRYPMKQGEPNKELSSFIQKLCGSQ